ncbi:MAG: hypothetical protein Mars2KO_12830 [Maribacter sp.]
MNYFHECYVNELEKQDFTSWIATVSGIYGASAVPQVEKCVSYRLFYYTAAQCEVGKNGPNEFSAKFDCSSIWPFLSDRTDGQFAKRRHFSFQ